MFTAAFWKQAAERAIKTLAQVLVAGLTVEIIMDGAQLVPVLIGATLAAVLSVLTSIASIGAADKGTPSLVKEPEPDPVLPPLPPQHLPEQTAPDPEDDLDIDEHEGIE